MTFDRKCLTLRASGYEASEIAEMLEVREDRVKRCIEQRIKSLTDGQRIDSIREKELEKLDNIESAFMPFATESGIDNDGNSLPPDTDSANMVLKTMNHRSKLLGLSMDKPDMKGINTINNFTLVQLLAEMSRDDEKVISPSRLDEKVISPSGDKVIENEGTKGQD